MSIVNIKEAVEILKKGQPVALPTETVYGLAAPIDNAEAIQKIFKIKRRPLSDPLIVHAANLEMALNCFKEPSEDLIKLAKIFWPGPLTLVYNKSDIISDTITADLNSVAVRIPANETFRQIINEVGGPLAAPSANFFKKVSPTNYEHILESLPNLDVVKGEVSNIGIESTIYEVSTQKILRPGHITHKDIESIINKEVTYSEKLNTPGSEVDHYQPESPVYVFEDPEKLKNFHSNYSELKLPNLAYKAQKILYSELRRLDKNNKPIHILYNPLWTTEDWLGVKNRLQKAATKWIKS